jgi:outer membrane protein assembly factor BamB
MIAWAHAFAQASLSDALANSRIRGGLCVIVGPADAELAARIAKSGPFLVHVLCTDPAKVDAARRALLAQGLYGKATVEAWQGAALPYADNLVSLLIVLDQGDATSAELNRVLRPHGEMISRQANALKTTVKPPLEGTDQWTHWRHGPDRNVVSHDRLVDLPQRVQWLFTSKAVGERSHMVLTRGRAFAQDRDTIIARDAFNGLPLWTAKLQKGKDFDWEYSVKVAALIVASGERVYALLDDGKFKALDAATGKPLLVYEQAGTPHDVVLVEDGAAKLGTLVLAGKDSIRALDAASGELLWKQDGNWPHNLIAAQDAAFYIEGSDRRGDKQGEISARQLRSGKLLWKKIYYWARRADLGAFGYDRIFYEMRSPHNWREFYAQHPEEKEQDKYGLVVISAKTGEEIQKVYGVGSSARHGEFRTAFWRKGQLLTEAHTREGLSLALYDPDSFGKPAAVFKANYVGDRGFGHCYPPVLTDRYYINGQLNFTDLETRKQVSNQITRGACNTARPGYLLGNGMIYTFPKHCACFPMLDGNVCLAPAAANPPAESHPLVRGPAWPAKPGEVAAAQDWPTFRHDEYRTSGTTADVPADLKVLWTQQIAGPDYSDALATEWLDSPYTAGQITAPVIANGTVYVAQSDSHRLIALDARTGKPKWEFVANGRLDGPPTIHQGMCLIGCRSGWVYNVRALDGQLIWRLRAAPSEQRICSYSQVESPWPVAGSVLVADGLAYVSAGLHPHADGGVRVFCFRPETGEIVWQGKFADLGFADPWPAPFEPRTTRPDSDTWRTIRPLEYRYFDLPVRDGDAIAVSRCLFDAKSGAVKLQKASGFYQVKDGGAFMPRTAWRYNDTHLRSPVAACLGSSVFGTTPSSSQLFRVDFEKDKPFDTQWVQVSEAAVKAGFTHATNKISAANCKWSVESADGKLHLNRAMLAAGRHLFTITPKGALVVHRTEDGKKLAEMKLEMAAWDGLAAAQGRLYVSTREGKLLCLGAKP